MSVEALKSTRPVRSLLLKGADRSVIDSKGRTPVELIGTEVPEQLRNDLKGMLVSLNLNLICGYRKSPVSLNGR